ncbi:DUF262 domain-containing protein [Bacillus cereus]|uniref:GmrSD restriction endonuclease domain-containing protein n=1 Tax=Bacillus cereus TaxID=1396 RepID=UPI00124D8DDE|nr:DUF262 domain-containing protein [Bacillus cereus]KAB2455521.1 DUF262 domain-containing protein [Bacillus cereus]MCU4957238.1 DUF262 domain-containing protein [Bacillus cereus]
MVSIKNVEIEIILDGEIEGLNFFVTNYSDNEYCTESGLTLMAITDNKAYCYDAKRVDNGNFLNEYTETIIQLFINEYNKSVKRMIENLESGIESTQETTENDPNITIPYDPNSIRVTQGRFSLREIFEMINGTEYDESILDLSPDFQRNYVWDYTRKSRLIESILLKIPLPVFYLARNKEGKYQVVDGVQRLSVINEFFSNGFKLRNLEYLKEECDKRYFQKENSSSLHPKFVRHLRSYQIDCNIIEPDTPNRVKSDIFKRLNTGGRSLNNQEIRNSILIKESRDFVRDLANSSEFKLATNNSVKSKRMMDQELVIRFIGFYFLYKRPDWFPQLRYNGIMDEFLDNVVEILNNEFKSVPFNTIKSDFLLAMKNAFVLFEEYAFRKVRIDYNEYYKNMINKSLFTAFSVLLSNYDECIVERKGSVIKEFAIWLQKEDYLFESITYGTNDRLRVDTTFMLVEEFLAKTFGGSND